MYKNPLNAGKVSDFNSLKNQRNNGSIIKKYESKKLEIEPTELQKYYQYLTYQQPILDELNYVAERMRTEDIKTKNDDYNFIEDLKIKREALMKETSKKEGNDIARETLFDASSSVKYDDKTPTINTDIELEILVKEDYNTLKNELFDDELFSNADTIPKKEEKFELSKEKRYKTPEQLAEKEAKKAEAEAKKAEAKKEKAATKIQNAMKTKKAIQDVASLFVNKKIDELKSQTEEAEKKAKEEAEKKAKEEAEKKAKEEAEKKAQKKVKEEVVKLTRKYMIKELYKTGKYKSLNELNLRKDILIDLYYKNKK
jgi:hypothetical protein